MFISDGSIISTLFTGYAFESLMINEFHNRQFPCSQFVPEGPGYGDISNSERVCSMVGSIPGSNFVDGGM